MLTSPAQEKYDSRDVSDDLRATLSLFGRIKWLDSLENDVANGGLPESPLRLGLGIEGQPLYYNSITALSIIV